MKKQSCSRIVWLVVLLVISNVAGSQSFAGNAYQQSQQAAQNSSHAAENTSQDGAREQSGYTFDSSRNVSPPVDLSGAGENATPQLLRNSDGSNPYTPQRYRTLRPSTVPPLP